jgi:hypothetical protein
LLLAEVEVDRRDHLIMDLLRQRLVIQAVEEEVDWDGKIIFLWFQGNNIQ